MKSNFSIEVKERDDVFAGPVLDVILHTFDFGEKKQVIVYDIPTKGNKRKVAQIVKQIQAEFDSLTKLAV